MIGESAIDVNNWLKHNITNNSALILIVVVLTSDVIQMKTLL